MADQRAALRHAIAHGEGELYLVKELLHLAVKRGTTDNHFLKRTAESLDQTVADLGIDGMVNERHGQGPTNGTAGDHRHNLLSVDLFENQRNAYHEIGAHLGQCGEQQFRGGSFSEYGHVSSHSHRHEHVERTPVGMRQR